MQSMAVAADGVFPAEATIEVRRPAAEFNGAKLPGDMNNTVGEVPRRGRVTMDVRLIAIGMVRGKSIEPAIGETRLPIAPGGENRSGRILIVRAAVHTGTGGTAARDHTAAMAITRNIAAAIAAGTSIAADIMDIITAVGGTLGRGGR